MASDFAKEEIDKTVYTLKENVQVRRLKIIDSPLIGSYMHQKLDFETPSDVDVKFGLKFCSVNFNLKGGNVEQALIDSKTIANNLAVHVFSYKPIALTKDVAPSGTNPEDILMEQEFSILGTQTVGEVWNEHKNKIKSKHGTDIEIENDIVIWECGEGIEKKDDSFGSEVESLLKGEH